MTDSREILTLVFALTACGPVQGGEHYANAYTGDGTHVPTPPQGVDAGPRHDADAGPCMADSQCPSGEICLWDEDGGNHHCRPVGLAGDYGCRLGPNFEDCGYMNGLPLNCVDYADAGTDGGLGCCSPFSDHCP